MKVAPALVALVLGLGLAGCVNGPSIRDYALQTASVELLSTPFFPQTENQCGPAALATVLGASGVPVTPEMLTPYIYLPHRKGSLQAEIIAATRRHGRLPYVIQPQFEDLLAEVSAGTPVLVLQNLGLRLLPKWHYAVVIGYDAASDRMLLRSGTRKRLNMNRIRFQGTWARADNWAMVAASAGSTPTTATSYNWLMTASALEELGQAKLAEEAYETATGRWPEQPLTWQALANARYARGSLSGAESALRRGLAISSSAAAHNNLAQVLKEQGCLTEAMAEIDLAEAAPGAEQLIDVLRNTRSGIEAGSGSDAKVCAVTVN